MSDSVPAEPPKGPILSFGRVWALAQNTFTQLVRMRIFFFLLIFFVVVAAVAFLFFNFSEEQELKTLRDIGLGAMGLFSIIFAIVGTAILLPKDVEDRTIYTILSKPVPRLEYLLGKFIGVVGVILVSLIAMDLIFSGLLWMRESASSTGLKEALAMATPGSENAEVMQEDLRRIEALGLTWSIHQAVLAIFLKAVVLVALAMFLSTFASSTLFTVVVGFAVFFIGHGQALARAYFLSGGDPSLAERLISAALALLFPDLQIFNVSDSIAGGGIPEAGLIWKLCGLAGVYSFFYILLSYLVFANKEI